MIKSARDRSFSVETPKLQMHVHVLILQLIQTPLTFELLHKREWIFAYLYRQLKYLPPM